MLDMANTRICPVCGAEMEDFPCEICKVCDWESDWYQEECPESDAGPNHISLNQARAEWKAKQEQK